MSVLKLVKLQSLFAKCCKMQKYKHVKFANFVYFRITRGKLIPLSRKRFYAVVMILLSICLKILSIMESVH